MATVDRGSNGLYRPSLARLPVPPVAGRLIGAAVRQPDGRTVRLDADIARIAALFDGRRAFPELCRAAGAAPGGLTPDAVADAIRACDEADLLDDPGPLLATLPVTSLSHGEVPCYRCGAGCYRMAIGPLEEADLARLAAVVPDRFGLAPDDYVEEQPDAGGERGRFLRKGPSGACVFFDVKERLCRVHRDVGLDAKPLACQAFPARLMFVPGGLRLSLMPHCLERHRMTDLAAEADQILAFVRPLQAIGWGRTSPFSRWVLYLPERATVDLLPGAALAFSEYLQLEQQLLGELDDDERPVGQALAQVLRGVLELAHAAPPSAADVLHAARDAVVTAATTLRDDTGPSERHPAWHDAFDGLVRHLQGEPQPRPLSQGTSEPAVQDFACELVAHEIFNLTRIDRLGSALPMLAMIALHLTLAEWLAAAMARAAGEPVTPAQLNLAFSQVDFALSRLEVADATALVPWAAAAGALPL
ncbi:MAG: YkgJ family cysteine cluster protein [Deltaproteobacteria bacterium]|jgi:Fe-S-cluster containining protein|nr:YkgJ family cysteine cluster protein [Deltaproteobacteria bacterium]MBW2536183.1 YkgJ family cysteine cluster protein [Deltaproteobacteria bacterium]